MCRYVVYALPEKPGDRATTYKPGDVIEIVEDGFFLGNDIERGHPAGQSSEPKWWMIIESPGVSVEEGMRTLGLMNRAEGNTLHPFMTDLGHRSHKRARHLNLDMLRAKQKRHGIMTTSDIQDCIEVKTPVPGSKVIG